MKSERGEILQRVEKKSAYETGSKTKFVRGQIRCDWNVCMVIGGCLMGIFNLKSKAVTSDTISVP